MKKITTIILSLLILASNTIPAMALGMYEAGIYRKTNNNSQSLQYEEVSLVTGYPAILKGTVTIRGIDKEKEENDLEKAIQKIEKDQAKLNANVARQDRTRQNNEQNQMQPIAKDPIPAPRINQVIELKGRNITQSYELHGVDSKGNEVNITRDVTITPYYEYYQGQKIATAKITKYSENMEAAGKQYTLNEDLSEISESTVTDRKPAIEYYAGNSTFYKVFDVVGGEESERLIIQMDSRSAGYEQYWGATQSKTFNYTINTYGSAGAGQGENEERPGFKPRGYNPMGVNGTYTVKIANNTNKDFGYSENDPMRISFDGGYFIAEQNHSALEYTYDVNSTQGRGNLEFQNNPSVKRLFAPVLTDMQGHWAEESVKIITSLGGFDPAKRIFLPASSISREEFARAILYSSGLFNDESKDTRLKPEIFSDVRRNDPSYQYIKKIVEKEIMIGRDENKFEPKEPITRMEAISIMTNSLGLEKFIPNGSYSTGFLDEYSIPHWAYESAYIAQAIGLVEKGGYLNPNQYISKAEACELLARYMSYMINDLKEDYMYGTLNY